jgi:hypothetical protein
MSELGGGRRLFSRLSKQLFCLLSRDDIALLLIEMKGFREQRGGFIGPLG